ncbi:MAG: hypothetical protein WDW19_01215 [Neisseriaceae bacterium]
MSSFKNALHRFRFFKDNHVEIRRLLLVRLQLIAESLISLQKRVLISFILGGMAATFFFMTMMALFFGIETLISDITSRLLFFFSFSALMFVCCLLVGVWAFLRLRSPLETIGDSIRALQGELTFLLTGLDKQRILEDLGQRFSKEEAGNADENS